MGTDPHWDVNAWECDDGCRLDWLLRDVVYRCTESYGYLSSARHIRVHIDVVYIMACYLSAAGKWPVTPKSRETEKTCSVWQTASRGDSVMVRTEVMSSSWLAYKTQ